MSGEAPVFAGVTEAAAGDIEAANFGHHGGDDENEGKQGQDRQSSEIKTTRDQRESANDFQPGQIKCELHANRPWQDFVIIDVAGEANRVEHFEYAGINENSADDKIDDAPKDV